MLEVKGVRCGYDNKEIVKGVSFNIERGNNLCIVERYLLNELC